MRDRSRVDLSCWGFVVVGNARSTSQDCSAQSLVLVQSVMGFTAHTWSKACGTHLLTHHCHSNYSLGAALMHSASMHTLIPVYLSTNSEV